MHHHQAFRHLYVLATEARWIQTVDVDTSLPVYVPLEITTKETELYSETSFCEVTPCSLPERAIVSLHSPLPIHNHMPFVVFCPCELVTLIEDYRKSTSRRVDQNMTVFQFITHYRISLLAFATMPITMAVKLYVDEITSTPFMSSLVC